MLQIAAVFIADEQHPVEVQEWFDTHPTATIAQIIVQNDIFYIVFQN